MSLSHYQSSYGYCSNASLEQWMIKESPYVCVLKEQLTLLFEIIFNSSIELSSEEGGYCLSQCSTVLTGNIVLSLENYWIKLLKL